MNVPLNMLSTPVLMTMLLNLQERVQRPEPKPDPSKDVPGYRPEFDLSGLLLMGGSPKPKPLDERSLGKAIVAELWDRGAWSLQPIDAARAVEAADALVKGQLA